MEPDFNKPRVLGNKEARKDLLTRISDVHVKDLNNYVKRLRKKRMTENIPYFDPNDGGSDAKVLFLLEAPGRRAVESGFVSRNNDDVSAKNMFSFLHEAGFDRKKTVLWNIVPWYLGNDNNIRPARKSDIEEGLVLLYELLTKFLSKIEVIVLVGRKAQSVKESLEYKYPNIKIFCSYHPSPQFVNRKKGNRDKIIKVFKDAKEAIKSS